MIVYVAFDFFGVNPKDEQGEMILQEVKMSLETMRVGFDASDCWVSSVISGEDDVIKD